eukprot:2723811-Rhodomonas_salina.1
MIRRSGVPRFSTGGAIARYGVTAYGMVRYTLYQSQTRHSKALSWYRTCGRTVPAGSSKS